VSRAPIESAVIVVRGDRIEAIGPPRSVAVPADAARVIDGTGLYALPGLIDLHLHFTSQRGMDFRRYRDSENAAAIRATVLARDLVHAGITTVREPGSQGDLTPRLEEAIERGLIDGPRIFYSGQLIVARGGHGDEITYTASGMPKSSLSSPRYRVATGPWDWRLAVREQYKMHADWVKLTAPFDREEVVAAVEEAHMIGLPVAVDSFGKYTLWAVEAGVDSVEHPLAMSDEIVAAMARRGTGFVPTMTAFYNVLATGYPSAGIPAGGFFYTMSRRFPMSHDEHVAFVRKAHRAGVRIGVGTDIPFENDRRLPADYHTELRFLRDAGLSNVEILAAATRVGADILKMGDRLGTLEPGKLADVLLVGGDPRADLVHLEDVRYVIADGRVVRETRPARDGGGR
jgi:imidazolonepropionase-like amidohydrolase